MKSVAVSWHCACLVAQDLKSAHWSEHPFTRKIGNWSNCTKKEARHIPPQEVGCEHKSKMWQKSSGALWNKMRNIRREIKPRFVYSSPSSPTRNTDSYFPTRRWGLGRISVHYIHHSPALSDFDYDTLFLPADASVGICLQPGSYGPVFLTIAIIP